MPQVKTGKVLDINFLGPRKVFFALSAILIVASFASVLTRGLNFGIDFTGGVLLEVGYPRPAELENIRGLLQESGYEGALVQNFGTATDVLVRLPPQAEGMDGSAIRDTVLALLRQQEPAVDLRRVEFVGPQVGEELTEQGALAMLFALLMILAYVSFRFQWKFSLGAVAALAHDVIITIGIFSLLQIPFDLAVLAAILAVIGYSLNDTIVIFDRIRENFLRLRRESSERVMNVSINQTLARTIVTGLTTLLVLFALLFVGGDALYGFSLALIIGVVVGTYSSIYIASATALALNVSTVDLLPPQREEDETLKELP
ncbi:MAG: protein translocase subunit SecF [Gammaproteobacteria bacterium]|nr:MAG: protein translocase subunit SecF [Gammaproteobacteria bacterium]